MGLFNFGKKNGRTVAIQTLRKEFNVDLMTEDDSIGTLDAFDRTLNTLKDANLSTEAHTVCLFRIYVKQLLMTARIKKTAFNDDEISFLIGILNRSVDWSEKAPDHVMLETLMSPVNGLVETLLEDSGVSRG